MKCCTKCKLSKPASAFYKDPSRFDGLRAWCKACCSIGNRKYKIRNVESIRINDKVYRSKNAKRIAEKRHKHYCADRERILTVCSKYRRAHREKKAARDKVYRDTHRSKIRVWMREYVKRRRRTDSSFRIMGNLRHRIWRVLKGERKLVAFTKVLGCSADFLRQYLQAQFQPGMTWENYGKWHVDHKRPCATFDLSKKREQKKCFHYTNLQPLWAIDNIRKRAKI